METHRRPDVHALRSSRPAALLAATLSAFLGTFMASSINIALPSIGRQLGLGPLGISWVATSYMMAAAMLLIPFGRLADIVGQKKVFLWGIAIYTLSSVIGALSLNGAMLIVSRVLQGIGSAMIFATGTAILISVFPAAQRGKVLGISVGAVYLGLTAGPLVGGAITQGLGWRFIFWLNLPLGLAIFSIIAAKLELDGGSLNLGDFDMVGAIALGASLVGLVMGLTKLPRLSGWILITTGIVLLVFFAFHEFRYPHALIDTRILRQNPVFIFSNLAALINYSTTAGVSFLMSLYLQQVKGLSPRQAGLLMVVQPAIQSLFAPLAGRLSDRIEPRTVASAGMTATLVGLLLLLMLNASSSLVFIAGCMAFLGLGIALFSSPNTNAVMTSVDRRHYGVASAVVGTMRLVGQMSSMAIVMLIFALVFGQARFTEEHAMHLVKSARIAFIVFAVLCFLGIFASLARGKVNRPVAASV